MDIIIVILTHFEIIACRSTAISMENLGVLSNNETLKNIIEPNIKTKI